MIKNIFQTAIGTFLGVILGSLLGALWLLKQMKEMSEERLSVRKPNLTYSKFFRGESAKEKDYKFHSSDIVFPSKEEAGEALDVLSDTIAENDIASVSDFYNLVGGVESTFQDENYGWRHLTGAYIKRAPGGYVLVLPRPRRLDIS